MRCEVYRCVEQGCGVDRFFIGVDSDSGVGIFMSSPTPACLEYFALCCSHVEHSYARHLLQVRSYMPEAALWHMFVYFSGIKRIINTDDQMQWVLACVYSCLTRPGPGRTQIGSGDCSLHSMTEPFLRSRLINGQHYLNARCITAVPLIWGVFK